MYNKLFSKILDSSIWLEPSPTRIVWMMFIATMDEDGFVQFASVANVAHRAIITTEEAEKAITVLESPDLNSSDPDHEGRRIERVEGGWVVLNSAKYRDLVTRAMVKEQTRLRVARYRAKKRKCNDDVTPSRAVAVSTSDVHPSDVSEKLEKVKALFRKRSATSLDQSEKKAWVGAKSVVESTSPEDWLLLEWAYSQRSGSAHQYRRKDMATLLNNWNAEIDRARGWKENPIQVNGFNGKAPPPKTSREERLEREMAEAKEEYERQKNTNS